MDKLKINLIPPEIKEKARKQAKRSVIIRISIGFLGLLILITSGILGVIIYQNLTLQTLNAQLEQEKTRIATLKDKEAVVFFLKNRIDSINKYTANRYSQTEVLELLESLTPEGVNLANLTLDKNNRVALQGDTTSTLALDVFFNSLTDPKENEGKITKVSVESLGKTQSNKVRFSLVINMEGGSKP